MEVIYWHEIEQLDRESTYCLMFVQLQNGVGHLPGGQYTSTGITGAIIKSA